MRVPFRLTPKQTSSGVSPQPMSEDETIRGAVNRATAVIGAGAFDLAIAFEGGVDRTLWGTFACEWCAVVDRDGSVGLGGGTKVLLPEAVWSQLSPEKELGTVADNLFGVTGSGASSGIFGLLTRDLVTRASVHEMALALALSRLLNASLYEQGVSAKTIGALIVSALGAKPRRRAPKPLPSPAQLSLLHS